MASSVFMLSGVSRKVIRSMTEMMSVGKTLGCPRTQRIHEPCPHFYLYGELPEDLRSSVLVKILNYSPDSYSPPEKQMMVLWEVRRVYNSSYSVKSQYHLLADTWDWLSFRFL